jgi:NAD(P)-dependent dehydrogenase (short-subunit alcohol dehydrogenase family)
MAMYLIMGGVGGIGEATARRLAQRGHRVVITSREGRRAEALAAELGGRGLAMDALDEASLQAAVTQAASDGQGLAGLVYAIGSIPLKPLTRLSEQDFVDAFRLNTLGAALAVKHAAPALKAANGSVVLFSTVAVQQGFANHAAIAMAKGGVEGLTRALAAELAPAVRVNAIAPSLTATPLGATIAGNEKMAEAVAAMHPIPRLGTADEVAALAAFLLSAEAGWITGQIIGVDGGRSSLRVKG